MFSPLLLEDSILEPSKDESAPVIDLSDAANIPRSNRSLITLALICTLTLGVYYAYDVPASLSDEFLKFSGGSHTHYELLYTAYAAPNAIGPIISGVLSDKYWGPHKTALFATGICCFGSILVAVGCQLSSFEIALCGRVCLGLGGETIFSLQQTMCSWWFDKGFRPLAMSVAISLGSLGEVLNFLVTDPLREVVGFAGLSWCVVLPCALSTMAAISLMIRSNGSSAIADAVVVGKAGSVSPKSIQGGEFLTNDERCASDDLPALHQPDTAQSSVASSSFELFRFEPLMLYLISMGSSTPYYIFPSIAEEFITSRWEHPGHSLLTSPRALLVAYYLVPIPLSLVVGRAIESASAAQLRTCLSLGCGCLSGGFLLFNTTAPPLASGSVVAVGSVLVSASLTPLLSLAVSNAYKASAFGVWSASLSVCTGTLSVALGLIVDTNSIAAGNNFLVAVTSVALALSLVLGRYKVAAAAALAGSATEATSCDDGCELPAMGHALRVSAGS